MRVRTGLERPMVRKDSQDNVLRSLVVDDNDTCRLVLSKHLELVGSRPLTASTVKGALQLLSNKTFDIVFVDMILGKDLGTVIVSDIRRSDSEFGRHTFVVAVTGAIFPEDVSTWIESGSDFVLPKPVVKEQLAFLIQVAWRYRQYRSIAWLRRVLSSNPVRLR